MTTLQEAAMRQSFEAWAKPILGDNPTWKESGECELAWQSWKAALAQQGEPVAQARLGMKDGLAMALSVVELYGMKGDVIYREIAKLRDGIAAAPAPQAQPAQASGRTNPGDETGGAVERFGWQTFLGKSPEIVPATNGSFVWYSDYLKLWQSAQPEDGCAPNHMCNGHRVHIPTGECCNKCGATSW